MRIANPIARIGEDLACDFLKRKGYKILERNWRVSHGEIDIIATHQNTLVFVEVKTRTTDLYGGAIEAIGYYKLQELIKGAQFYKATHKHLPESLRIDAVLITLEKNTKKSSIEHIQNISM